MSGLFPLYDYGNYDYGNSGYQDYYYPGEMYPTAYDFYNVPASLGVLSGMDSAAG